MPEQVNAAHILVVGQAGRRSRTPTRPRRRRPRASRRAPGSPAPISRSSPTRTPTTRAARATGGQLPPFSRGQMVPEFEAQAFDMAPGEVRGPIKTQFGYHIIKLNAKTPGAHALARRSAPGARRRALRAAGLGGGRAARPRARGEAQGHAVGLRRGPAQAPERRRHLQHDGVVRPRATPSRASARTPKFSDEAWTLPVGQGLRRLRSRPPAGPPSCGRPRSAPPVVAALRRAEDPPRAGLEGRAAREGRAGAARARGERARLPARRSPPSRRATGPRSRRRPSSDRPAPFPRSAPRRSSSAAAFQTPQGQAGPAGRRAERVRALPRPHPHRGQPRGARRRRRTSCATRSAPAKRSG